MGIVASGNGFASMDAAEKEYRPHKKLMVERNCSWCLREQGIEMTWPWWINEEDGLIVLRYVSNGAVCPQHSQEMMTKEMERRLLEMQTRFVTSVIST